MYLDFILIIKFCQNLDKNYDFGSRQSSKRNFDKGLVILDTKLPKRNLIEIRLIEKFRSNLDREWPL